MAKYTIGTRVRLVSGGPVMVVTSVVSSESTAMQEKILYKAMQQKYSSDGVYYVCAYFTKENALKEDIFQELVLAPFDETE